MFDILTTEDFSFRAEVDEYAQVLLHVEVYKSTPRVFKQMRMLFEDTKEALHLEGFSRMYTITPNKKFVYMVTKGGESKGEFEGNEVIVWELH